MIEPDLKRSSLSLSKRAARRLIQRASVLIGRDRHVREHIRAARVLTLWVVEDWKLAWTLELDRGKLHFERRPAKHPDLILTWKSARAFFEQVEGGLARTDGFEIEGSTGGRKSLDPVFRAFCSALCGLLRNPVDDDGESLL